MMKWIVGCGSDESRSDGVETLLVYPLTLGKPARGGEVRRPDVDVIDPNDPNRRDRMLRWSKAKLCICGTFNWNIPVDALTG